jgi:hypothetical protein
VRPKIDVALSRTSDRDGVDILGRARLRPNRSSSGRGPLGRPRSAESIVPKWLGRSFALPNAILARSRTKGDIALYCIGTKGDIALGSESMEPVKKPVRPPFFRSCQILGLTAAGAGVGGAGTGGEGAAEAPGAGVGGGGVGAVVSSGLAAAGAAVAGVSGAGVAGAAYDGEEYAS